VIRTGDIRRVARRVFVDNPAGVGVTSPQDDTQALLDVPRN
jgi:hypothetical protein